MYRVKFEDVGRDKQSWEATVAKIDYPSLMKSIRAHGALGSRDVDLEMTGDASGVILVGGFREVGTFSFTEAESVFAPSR